MAKKYYWLKLDINFFDKEEIKLIEGMPNGKDYIIFYMKLLLKSANTSGRLMFRDVIPYTVEMLSSVTNTNPDTVMTATDLFVKLGMMERLDDGALFMLETENMVGCETEFAKKKREYRKNKILALEDNTKTKKDNVRQEIEIDKEIDKDKDKNKKNASKVKLSKSDKTKADIDKLDVGDKLKDSLKEFVDYRKELKKEITIRSINMSIKKLNDKSVYRSEEHLIESIENSIGQGYQGIFPFNKPVNRYGKPEPKNISTAIKNTQPIDEWEEYNKMKKGSK